MMDQVGLIDGDGESCCYRPEIKVLRRASSKRQLENILALSDVLLDAGSEDDSDELDNQDEDAHDVADGVDSRGCHNDIGDGRR